MRCRVTGCTELVRGGPFCEKHIHTNPRSTQETAAYYQTVAWRKFSAFIRMRNPICQAITNGVRCMKPAALVHHLQSPKVAPERLLDASNVCALCAGCHPKEDTPHWKPGTDFEPTVHSLSI